MIGRPATAAKVEVHVDQVDVLRVGDEQEAAYFVRASCGEESGVFGPIDRIIATYVLGQLAPSLRGFDATDPSRAHGAMMRAHRHGHSGIAAVASGALDCALWDLRGRLAGVAVFELIGGLMRETVPAYASLLGYDPASAAGPELASAAMEEGYCGVKWPLPPGPQGSAFEMAPLRKLRDALGSSPLMVDAGCAWTLDLARKWCHQAEDLEIFWLEDPLPPDDLAGLAELGAEIEIPIASGEHGYTFDQARSLLSLETLAALLSDVGWCGLTTGRRIAAACRKNRVPLYPHSAGILPALHLAIATSATTLPCIEFHMTLEPRRQRWFANPITPTDGHLTLPELPGLGVELRSDLLARAATATSPRELWNRP
jgi:L-alanine-DL-glutamate epimerase-like enolase superfamily enzyme